MTTHIEALQQSQEQFSESSIPQGVEHGPHLIEDPAEFVASSTRTSRLPIGVLDIEDVAIRDGMLQDHANLLKAKEAYEAGRISRDDYGHMRRANTPGFPQNKR